LRIYALPIVASSTQPGGRATEKATGNRWPVCYAARRKKLILEKKAKGKGSAALIFD
jgi:hypothetical protein